MQKVIVQNLKCPLGATTDDILAMAKTRLVKLVSKSGISSLHLYKKSVDARKKDDICFVCSVMAEIEDGPFPAEKAEKLGIVLSKEQEIVPVFGEKALSDRPVVVGFGPCGMFAALLLARNGYRPIVIERGKSVAERQSDVARFYEKEDLNPDSNIQFGAGGAGTFSDGKLVTRIGDPKGLYVLEEYARLGAPRDILFQAKPHIGTDYLCTVVSRMDEEIRHLGGDIFYETKLTGLSVSNASVRAVVTNRGEIPCGAVLLAIGHSARDTFRLLRKSDLLLIPKPFSVGVRIEHLQEDIDHALYGKMAGNPLLPPGEYNLSCHYGNRGVYTFCMCPGGEVVAATSQNGGIVTNGMSSYKRDGKNANCAVAVSVLPDDFGNTVDDAIEYQKRIEEQAYRTTGNYHAPCETVGHFLKTTGSNEPGRVKPTYMNGKVTMTDLHNVLPEMITDSLAFGLRDFNRKISGFSAPDAVLTGPETRTSSPIRILRNDNGTADGFDNLYVGGEGAGYAGGITSASVDGIRLALSLMERYRPIDQ